MLHIAFLVAAREYLENLKTKGFWMGIIFFPLIWTLAIKVPVLIEKKGVPTRYFVVIDPGGKWRELIDREVDRRHQREVLDELVSHARRHLKRPADRADWLDHWSSTGALDEFIAQGGKSGFLKELDSLFEAGTPEFIEPRRHFQRTELPSEVTGDPATSLVDRLRPWLKGEQKLQIQGEPVGLFAAVLIPNVVQEAPKNGTKASDKTSNEENIQFWSDNLADPGLEQLISETVGRELRAAAYQAKGMNPSTVQEIEAIRVPLVSLNPRKAAGEERVGLGDRIRQWIPSAFVYLLWVAVFVSSQMLLTSVIEEKSNRIIEVLLSSVTPEELMTGKLYGIALTGLTMLFLWIASAMGVLYLNTSKGSVAGTAENIPVDLLNLLQTTWLLPAFLGYFILGFLVFATFFLALGSTCNTLKEAQNMMGMVMPVLIVPLLTIPFIPRDPNGTLARVLSWIPPFTPFVMMNRVTGHPPILDVVGTLLLLGGFVAFEVWAAARIFRVGVLRTGQPPKWLEMARWLRSGA